MARTSRRRLLAGTLGGFGATVLAGCANPRGLSAAFYQGSAGVNQTLLRFFRRLATTRPGLTVRPQYGAFDGYFDKLAVSFAGDTAADVVMLDATHLADYARRGALRALGDAVPGRIDPARCRPDVLSGGSGGDTLYGVPDGQHSQALLVDASAAGALLEPPGPAELTWSSYGRWATEIHRISDGRRHGTEDAGGLDLAFAAGELGTVLGSPPSRSVFDRVRRAARGLDRTILDYDAMVLRAGRASRYPPTRPPGSYQLLSGKTSLLNRANDSVGYGLVSPSAAAADFFRQARSILQT